MRGFFDDRAFQAALRASVAVLLVFALVTVVLRGSQILEPLVVSIVLATALWPWVSRLADVPLGPRGWRLPRVLATSIVYAVTFSAAGLVIWIAIGALLPEIDRGLATYPDQTTVLRDYLQPFRTGDVAGGAGKLAGDVAREAVAPSPASDATAQNAPVNVVALALGMFGGVLQLALVLVFTFFLLLEGGSFSQWMLRFLPLERRADVQTIGFRIRDRISMWVLAQVI
jgi:predicted PurR-regulated permease PerM